MDSLTAQAQRGERELKFFQLVIDAITSYTLEP